jgi:hypothetical protein
MRETRPHYYLVMRRTRPFLAVALLMLSVATIGPAVTTRAATGPQAVGNLYANWSDGETWSRYLEATSETEVGLGLQPTGKAGTMMLAFSARWTGRDAKGPPREIFVQIASPPVVNPLVLRTPTLIFVVSPRSKDQAVLDVSSRLSVDKPGAGQTVSNGLGKIDAKELARIAQATSLEGTVLGLEVVYTPAQRRAIRDFAQKISVK